MERNQEQCNGRFYAGAFLLMQQWNNLQIVQFDRVRDAHGSATFIGHYTMNGGSYLYVATAAMPIVTFAILVLFMARSSFDKKDLSFLAVVAAAAITLYAWPLVQGFPSLWWALFVLIFQTLLVPTASVVWILRERLVVFARKLRFQAPITMATD